VQELKEDAMIELLIAALLLAPQQPPPAPPDRPSATPPPPPSAPAPPSNPRLDPSDPNFSSEINRMVEQRIREALAGSPESNINVTPSPEFERALERQIERHMGRMQPDQWRWHGFLALLLPFAFLGVIGIAIWLKHRRNEAALKARLDFQTHLLSKFNSGKEFSEFLAAKGGQELLENLSVPQQPPRPRMLRSMRIGIFCSVIGIALLITEAVDDHDFSTGGAIVLAIGIGYMVSTYLSYRMAEKMGLFREETPQQQQHGPSV
jgi:hypothetical protein